LINREVDVSTLKNVLLLSSLVAGFGLQAADVNRSIPASYSASDIKVVGTLNSGQTSPLVEYVRPGQYRAFVFEGNGHDSVDITVTGADGKAFVALADSTLTPIASGIGHLSTTLPYHGPDVEAFYILLKPTSSRPARFAVRLKKVPAGPQAIDATR
jgi:hypothetical protein